ncbi:MAG: isopentenyl-diphosphate delta-isomerase [Saprospiraceae bacterium]|nr:type 2 isopentenyl-diphosphate Delta-isomerase [Candidatus Vicinibacter affinis]
MSSNQPDQIDRKDDHITLAFRSGTPAHMLDNRFEYDPIHGIHPDPLSKWPSSLCEITLDYPVWISSMTGGTAKAKLINSNLARLCNEFKLGMGLGSCRKLIDHPEFRSDFAVRKIIGGQPLFANLGIAQLEHWIADHKLNLIKEIMEICEADGLIIHINPMQEYMQPEGDRLKVKPIDTVKRILDAFDYKIIVKEVGQGMGFQSLDSLLSLPLEAIEFGAFGGTNFALLELLRDEPSKLEAFTPLANIGHTAEEMVQICNHLLETKSEIKTKNLIISGGVQHFLDAYYLMSLSSMPSLYGMASAFLKHAMGDYDTLKIFFEQQISGLNMCRSFLKIKNHNG